MAALFRIPGITVLLLHLLLAQVSPALAGNGGRTYYEEAIPRPHEPIETWRYLGYIYLATLPVYLIASHNQVFNNATLTNYAENFGNIAIFDQDLPSSNWGVHLITGTLAYEFYRARSYSKTDAFLLTLAQESLFQFTVETMLFPTGLENIVNTAVIGSILGRGLEVASFPLLNSDIVPLKALGYILNIPVALGFHENKTTVAPMVGPDAKGVQLQVRF